MKIWLVASAQSIHTKKWATGLVQRGHDVRLLSVDPGAIQGVTVQRLGPAKGPKVLRYLLGAIQLRWMLRRDPPDIVNAHYASSAGVLAAVAGAKPLVVSTWGSDLLVAPRRFLPRILIRYAMKKSQVVTHVSENLRAAAIKLGVAPDRLLEAGVGVDLHLFTPSPILSTAPSGIASVRAFLPHYRVGDVLAAMLPVLERHAEARLYFAGTGPLEIALQEKAAAARVRNQIAFLGAISQERMVELLQACQIYVSASETDGTSLSLGEAMACGLFPVVSDISANTPWITHGVNGFLFPVGDVDAMETAVERAIASPALRNRARTINREIVERRLDWHKCLAQLEEAYARAAELCTSPERRDAGMQRQVGGRL